MTQSSTNLFRAQKAKPERGPELSASDPWPEQKAPPKVRRDRDAYFTEEPEAIRTLLARDGERIRQSGTVWEPACGAGHLVREIRAFGVPCCASDLVPAGCEDSWAADFFTFFRSRGRAIITNPPYDQINARDGHGRWLKHTLDMPGWDYLALLLSWDWPMAHKNGLGALLDARPFTYSYAMRWKIDFTGEGAPPQRNAWFVWDRYDRRATDGSAPEPSWRWLNRQEDWRQAGLVGL